MTDEMADDDAPPVPAKKKRGMVFLLLIIGLPLLLIGGAAGAYFAGLFDSMLGGKAASETAASKPKETVFYDLPDMLVNLNTGGKKTSFLKIGVSLQIEAKTDEPKIVAVQPRIIDTFQSYLRELRPEDLRGSAGLYRLREELLIRVSAAAAPIKVDDVLFKEMLVQ
jgi:flagellar FliL protein